jgi:hypothetical protein
VTSAFEEDEQIRWHIEHLEIFREVCFGEGLDTVKGGLVSGQTSLELEEIP